VRAVKQFLREQELLCLEVAGLSKVYWSLRDESIVLRWYDFFRAVNVGDFKFRKFRVCCGLTGIVDSVAYLFADFVHIGVRHANLEGVDFLESGACLVGQLAGSAVIGDST
jgi:hypothetical protein